MKDLIIGRRDFIRLPLIGLCFSLSGCQLNVKRPILSAYPGVLPKDLTKTLPFPWSFKSFKDQQIDAVDRFKSTKNYDLLAIGDGWLQTLNMESFAPFVSRDSIIPLNNQARSFLSNFETEIATKLLPIALSPWAMLFRNGKEWMPKANETWEVLLEPGLRKQVILPNSSRVVMSLADRIGGSEVLRKLRLQVKTYDDRNALNWLISGKAKVVVMPLQNCMSVMSKDPRLTLAIPTEGTLLNWTLLLKTNRAMENFPVTWIQEINKMPLLEKLLLQGWMPPSSSLEILKRTNSLEEMKSPLLLFLEKGLEKSWSLSPLNEFTRTNLEERWLNSTP